MKTMNLDRNLYSQIGLDSGSLTMLGAVVHSFGDPGEYRGTVRSEDESKGVFYISVDKNSPVAQVDIDLAALTKSAPQLTEKDRECEEEKRRFSVNPRGYALFRVSGGEGGYNVHVRKAEEAEDIRIFDSRKLSDGAIFSCMILRPGTYSVTNVLGKARAEAVVAYPPEPGKTAYRPPAPLRVYATSDAFDPTNIELMPAQGLIFECKSPSRIKIELEKPDDGPRRRRKK
jgi:hypothetical protein